MRLTHDLFIEQQQKLLMTPELRQAIAILQMSTLELGEYLQRELEENPVLEQREAEEPIEYEKEEQADKTEEWLEIFNDRDIGMVTHDADKKSFDNFMIKRPSLYEHLQFQLQMAYKERLDLAVGNYLIGSIDSNGYLAVDLTEVATQTGADLERVERVLQVIQSLHPHGVGARDLTECLLIQLKHYGKEDPQTIEIIKKHLEDLSRGRLNKIAQILGISTFQVQQIYDFIRTLDPRPGLQYSSDEVKYIIPDVVVEKVDGQYIVVVNDVTFPRLIVNQFYENMMRNPEAFPNEARKYMEDKMNSAIWLIKSIEQRRMTLYKVASCIVNIQTEFLDRGVKYIKPLNLKRVADAVEVHESTVSRATSNKYIQTPQGLFELKYFFGSGIESYGGSPKVSSKSIKSTIDDLIKNEDTTNPLSDHDIVEMLKSRGIRISRRTVAKYRQEMGIQSTVARKRYEG